MNLANNIAIPASIKIGRTPRTSMVKTGKANKTFRKSSTRNWASRLNTSAKINNIRRFLPISLKTGTLKLNISKLKNTAIRNPETAIANNAKDVVQS